MKWIVGVLLVLNTGLFLWAYGKRPATTDFIRPTVNGETMMLISEIQPVKSTVVITPVKSTTEPDGESSISGGERTEEVRQGMVEQVPTLCLRVGPFYEENLAERTKERLKSMSLAVNSRMVQARAIRAYRVYVGPFDTRSELDAQRNELNAKGIRDHYIKRDPGKKDVISLGLFTQKTGANSLIDQLREKGVIALSEPEDRLLDPTFWLELTDSEANRKTHPELSVVKSWGDSRTKLTEYPCS